MLIGAHVSIAGGILTAFERAQEIGAEAVQIHPTPPQTWRRLTVSPETVTEFHSQMEATGLDAFFLHAVYLINLATAREDLLAQSEGSLRHYLEMANVLGARGVIFHPGSHKGLGFDEVLPQMAATMKGALDGAPGETLLIIENSHGRRAGTRDRILAAGRDPRQ